VKEQSLANIKDELASLPNLFGELNEQVFEDSLFKLLTEISKQNKEHMVSEEMISNLWSIKMFNRYPESSKTLMIYLILFKCLCVNEQYLHAYRIIKRLCRNYYNTPVFWAAFNHV